MHDDIPRDENQQAFRRLRPIIEMSYPKGRLIGIAGGKIVADAATVTELIKALREQGKEPKESLAVRAGGYYPEYVTILLER